MAVRNFWIEADIDGRKTKLKGGPANKHGGLSCYVYQRNHGGIDTAIKIYCYEDKGNLFTDVYYGNELIAEYATER